MSDPDARQRRAEAKEWFSFIDDDLRAIGLCLDSEPPLLRIAAYHAQQAAEKLTKALLTAAGVPFRRTHDLTELVEALASVAPDLATEFEPLRFLSSWSVVARYPSYEEVEFEPSRARISSALERLRRLREEASANIP